MEAYGAGLVLVRLDLTPKASDQLWNRARCWRVLLKLLLTYSAFLWQYTGASGHLSRSGGRLEFEELAEEGGLDEVLDFGGADDAVLGLGVEAELEGQRHAGVPDGGVGSVHDLQLELGQGEAPVAVRIRLQPLRQSKQLSPAEAHDEPLPVRRQVEVQVLHVCVYDSSCNQVLRRETGEREPIRSMRPSLSRSRNWMMVCQLARSI